MIKYNVRYYPHFEGSISTIMKRTLFEGENLHQVRSEIAKKGQLVGIGPVITLNKQKK